MANPTRFLDGVTTVPASGPLGFYPYPAPFHTGSKAGLGSVRYENDFDTFTNDYLVTGLSSTFALVTASVGGAAVLTPGGAAVASSAYKSGQFLQFQAGNKAWFVSRFQVSALAGTEYVGLQAGAAVTDGLWFAVSATGVISLVATTASVATTLVAALPTVALAATWVDVGFYYNGVELFVYQNDVVVARILAASLPLTTAILTPVFDIVPTASQTLTVDYVVSACELVR